MMKILILQFKQDEDFTNLAFSSVMDVLNDYKAATQRVLVEDPFSILCAASLSMEMQDYDGLVVLGILAKNTQNEMIYKEMLRCFSDLTVHYAMPVGFGVAIASDKLNIFHLVQQKSKTAASSCVELIKLKNQLGLFESETAARYSN